MKKRLTSMLMTGLFFSCLFVVSSCANSSDTDEIGKNNVSSNADTTDNTENTNDKMYSIYLSAKDSGYTETYEDWLNSIRGDVIELRIDSNFIQWKYKKENNWNNLIGLDSLVGATGKDGVDGKTTELRVSDGFIQWKYLEENNSSWRNLVSISSLTGATGKDGKSIEMKISETFIQWKYMDEAENSWRNLISLSSLTGAAGKDGKSTEMRVFNDYVQWKYVDDSDDSWKNIISLKTITGPQGESGKEIELSANNDYVRWRYVGSNEWNNLISLSLIKGDTGKSAYDIAVELGYDGSKEEWLTSLKGKDGVGIKSSLIDENGDLIITYTDGTIVNAGHVASPSTEMALDFYPYPDGTYGVAVGNGKYLEELSIPYSYNGRKVTRIVDRGFSQCNNLKKVLIPNSVTSIGNSAFSNCPSLTSIEIPNSVTSIGNSAFSSCPSLTSIEIPNSVTSIGSYAFNNCSSLTSIEIPNGVTSIGLDAFFNCSSLTSIEIPSSVTSIGSYAFDGCSSLTNVYYDGTIEEWCNIDFFDKYSTPMFYSNNLFFANENGEIEYNGNKYNELATELYIPNSVTIIKNYTFFNCKSLTSIEIPNSIKEIGADALYGCLNLRSIYYHGSDDSGISYNDSYKDIWYYYTYNGANETASGNWWYYDYNNTIQTVVNNYSVKFMNGKTELTDLKQSVEKYGKVTKPSKDKLPTQTGKRFDFWSADGGVTAYNFDDPVTSAVQLDAVFVDANEYDTLAASANKIVDYTFYNDIVAVVETASFDAEAATINTTNADNKITNDGKYHIEKDNLNIVLGDKKITTTGVLTVYFEVSFDAIKNGEAFFQIHGTSAVNTSATEVFGIRVVGGSDVDFRGKFGYRLDGGYDIASSVGPVVNTTYKIKVVLDTADGKASYSVDGVTMAENINVSINTIRGLKFTAKADTTSRKNVDNIVATFEAKADPVVTAKAAAIAALDEKTLSTDAAIKAAEEAKIAEAKTAISAATTVDDVNAAKKIALDYINATKYALTVKAYKAANTALEGSTDVVKVYLGTDTVSLDDVAFTGYSVEKIYTDATLATEYVPAALTANTVVYAKVALSSLAGSWSAADLTVTSVDKDKAIAAGTELTSICSTVGTVTCKLNGDENACIGYEVKQNGNGSIKIEVPTGKTVTVTLLLRSTSSNNTSDGIGVYNGDTAVVPTTFTPDSSDTTSAVDANGVITIKGTKDVTVVYTLAAGTYTLKNNASSTNNRGFRISSIEVVEAM